MNNKDLYIKFCEESDVYVPIFSQPWWLEAVSYGNWDVILAKNEANEILAANPYFFKKENEYEICKAPLTQNNGVIFNYPKDCKYVKKISFERKVLEEIIEELDKKGLSSYRQYFHYNFTNWLPYYWNGFSQTTRYTYVIEEKDLDVISSNMDAKLRNEIKKARKIVEAHEDMSIEDFYELNKQTYFRQNIDIPYSLDIVKRIDEACTKRETSKIFYAVDNKGNIHSAIYLVEDRESVYYLLSGSDPDYRESQSLSLLLMKGIEYAVSKNKKFDFEGSMKKNIERNFSQFGGIQKAYMDISKKYK